MVQLLFIAVALLASVSFFTGAFSPVVPSARSTSTTRGQRLHMAIDYNDPVVAEEFNKVQPMAYEDVEEELLQKGIRLSPTSNDMEAKLMLVEMRLRFSGKLREEKKAPKKFSSKFEEAMWTKPAFKEFYDKLKAKGDHNAQNVVAEYINNKDLATQRYGKTYKGVLRQAEEALNAPPPVKSPKLKFSGFPANMGEDACRMTLESVGPVVEFSCAQDDDFPILKGEVTFEDLETAKKAVAQYAGMDMGMGTALEMTSV